MLLLGGWVGTDLSWYFGLVLVFYELCNAQYESKQQCSNIKTEKKKTNKNKIPVFSSNYHPRKSLWRWIFIFVQISALVHVIGVLLCVFVCVCFVLPCYFFLFCCFILFLTRSCPLHNFLLKLRAKEWCKLHISFLCLILTERAVSPAAPGKFIYYSQKKNKDHICLNKMWH